MMAIPSTSSNTTGDGCEGPLTIDGVFVAFLADLMFASNVDAQKIFTQFATETVLLVLMIVALIGSIGAALMCVRSQTLSAVQLDVCFKEVGIDTTKARSYRPEVMWFFQMIARLQNQKGFERKMLRIDRRLPVTGSSIL